MSERPIRHSKIGARIRYVRNDVLNVTQHTLAVALGVSQNRISDWENGRHMPGFDKMIKLRNICIQVYPIRWEDRFLFEGPD